MTLSKAGLATRREHLAKLMARQRADLAEAYRDLGRPLKYTQVGIKGLQAVKENAWIIGVAPTVVGLLFTLFGLKKADKTRSKWFPFSFGKKKRAAVEEAGEAEGEVSRRARPLLTRLLRHGISAFKVYRKVRPFIPL
jgi:hypothetical protein